jgi:hemoglobin
MAETLYERLGGEEGISAIVRDTLDLHLKNPLINARYQDKDREKLHRLSVEFFSMGTGGPAKYTGRDMRETHKGMNISEQEFIAVIDDILGALDKNKIPPETKTEVLGILYSMKGEIVRI